MFGLPSLSRRRSSLWSRKPTANRSHGDHGNASDTSWETLGSLGNVVFRTTKQLTVITGETPVMAVYCFFKNNGSCSVLLPRQWGFNGTTWKKTLLRFSSKRRGKKTVNITPPGTLLKFSYRNVLFSLSTVTHLFSEVHSHMNN